MDSSWTFCVCALWIVANLCGTRANSTLHQQMLAKLRFPDYDSGVRPNWNGQAVVVEVDVLFISVGPVNEMEMTWSASFYLRQEWTDSRLVLDDAGTLVKLDGEHVAKLWRPDLFFSNNKQGRKHELTVPNHLVYINSSSGHILYSQRLTMVLNCEMDLIKFPHDNQTCDMKMESYSFTTKDLILRWSTARQATSLLPSANFPDFSIDGISTHDCGTTYAIGTFPCLLTTLQMSREIGFYIFQTYLPSILTVILSWASFWIDHEAVPARISVGLLTVLTITTQLSGSRAQLPRVPYIKAIDVWMSMNLVFVFSAYMEYAVVTVLSRKYKKSLTRLSLSDRRLTLETDQELVAIPPKEESSLPSTTTPNGTTTTSTTTTTATTPTPVSRQEPPPKAAPCVTPVLDSKDTGRKVDKISRGLFPLAYAIFNVIYWLYYLVLA
ncbi:hypothetical protein ACOMHN_052889 [Nucella lapillus]